MGQDQSGSGGQGPGDVAPAGTPGTGEALCPTCSGRGKVDDRVCETCGGSGKVTEGVGGA